MYLTPPLGRNPTNLEHARVAEELAKLQDKAEKHKVEQICKVYSEKHIKELSQQLDELKSLSERSWYSDIRAIWSKRMRHWYREEYLCLRAWVQVEIKKNVKEGLAELRAGNSEVVGSVLTFIICIRRHLSEHLDSSTRRAIDEFGGSVRDYVQNQLDRLERWMKNQHARNAIAELGPFLDFFNHVPLRFVRFAVVRFHETLHSFAEGQIAKLREAVSALSFDDALSTMEDLQSLSLILVTKFVLYRQRLESTQQQLDEPSKTTLATLVALQASKFDRGLASKGVHLAVLGLSPSAFGGSFDMPSSEDVKRAFSRQAKQFHEDKSRQFEQQMQRSVSLEKAKLMMPKLIEAKEYLLDDANRRSFCTQLCSFFMDELSRLPGCERLYTQKCLDEEKYRDLKIVLDNLKRVDTHLAVKMRVPVQEMWASIQDRVVQEVRTTQAKIQEKWGQRLLRELHEELGKLKSISRELAAYPKIVPEDLIRAISEKVTENVKDQGLAAQKCITKCTDLKDAMEHIWQFGGHLIELGHVLTHLGDYKREAELEVTHALNICYEKTWGANFLFELGMRLGQGRIGDPNRDGTIAKVLVNEFPHFKDVHTVMFNRETRATQKTVADTLKAICSKEVRDDGSKVDRGLPTTQLRKGWEEYNCKFDEYIKDWIGGELTADKMAQRLITTAASLRTSNACIWSAEVKTCIPELLAGIFALYTIIKSGDAYKRFDDTMNRSADSAPDTESVLAEDLLIKPHCIQILTLLCLTGYGKQLEDLENHVMQIRTGEGKSIALGGGAALLALLGFRVRCVCYSQYLSQRDFKAFSALFDALCVRNRIVYSTITAYSEDLTSRKGDVRKLTLDLVNGKKLIRQAKSAAKAKAKGAPKAKAKVKAKIVKDKSKASAAGRRSSKPNASGSAALKSEATSQEVVEATSCSEALMSALEEQPAIHQEATGKETLNGTSDAVALKSSPDSSTMVNSSEKQQVVGAESAASLLEYRDDAEEILLVDEVDVFFGSDFYGKTHNQVAMLESKEVERLLLEVWEHRDDAAQTHRVVEAVMQCAPYEALLQRFPDFADIVRSECVQMCADLKDHMGNPKDYIFDGNRIGYKVMDGVAFDVVKGYKTAFAYLQEAQKQPLPDEAAVLRKALVMRLPCGRFSYAKLGSAKILGVSGTVEKLDSYEWQVMRRFGIESYTVVPSVYGKNNFAFLNQNNGVPITVSKDEEHFYDIAHQMNKKVQEGRAAIVFFRDVKQVEDFKDSSYFSRIANKNVLLPTLVDQDKDWIARKAATSGQVTLAPAVFGRGTDFCCFDDKLEKAGGPHVIQSFFSEEISEEIQIQGRTARQGKSGTYSLILSESEIEKLGLNPESVRNMQPEQVYDLLDSARKNKQADRSQKMEEVLERANAVDARSHAYFDALLQGHCPSAKERLTDLYQELGRLSGSGGSGQYHVVCCYDESGSMKGRPWRELVEAHYAYLQNLQHMAGVRLSIVQFSHTARPVLELAELQQAMGANLYFKEGGTEFEPALEEAFRLMELGMQQFPQLTPVLLFMSDGDNGDGDCSDTIRSMQQHFPNLVLHAVIFRQSDSETLRSMVAAASDGHFHVSADGVSLKQTFTAIASGLEYTGR